jgi:predicted metal-dependent phosphoesterase TrpH
MNFWIIPICCIGLIIYTLLSVVFFILAKMKYPDSYRDEDVSYPRRKPAGVAEDAFIIDLHAHTSASDGLLTPAQLVAWSYANGYDGIVISDHNRLVAVEAARVAAARLDPSFVVIPGYEFTSMRVHLNFIGLQAPPVKRPNWIWPTKRAIIAAIENAHAQGAVVQFNHKSWYLYDVLKHLPREWWSVHGLDGWEVYNGFGFIDEEALDFIDTHWKDHPMFAGAGTDVHDPARHFRMYTEVLTNDRSVQGIIAALREGKTRAHRDGSNDGSQPAERPEAGKIILNPLMLALMHRWLWLGWIGQAIIQGTHRTAAKVFVMAVLLAGVLLSIVL